MGDKAKTEEQIKSDLKKTQKQVAISEEDCEKIFGSLPIGITIVDMKGIIQYCNPVIYELGYAESEFPGKHFTNISSIRARDIPNFLSVFGSIVRGKIPKSFETEYMRKDKTIGWTELHFSMIKLDGKRCILVAQHDVTDRKKVQEGFMNSEQNFRNSLEKSPLGIRIMNSDEEVLYANKALLDMYGYEDIEEMRSTPIKNRLTPESYTEYLERMDNQRNGKPIPESYEVNVVRRDREIRTLKVTRGEVVWNNEAQLMVLCEDITDQKRLQIEREEIQRQVQMASRLATVGEMAAGIAHEINNPLTGVVGFADLLLKRDLPEDIRKDVEAIAQGGNRVADIVKRMLVFARQSKPRRDLICINEVIETTLEMRLSSLTLNNIKVAKELDTALPEIVIDGGQLQQVFLNIIINAEKEMYYAHGKGNLLVKTERINGTIRISFKDDGPGILKENLEKIFEPFYTTRNPGDGTGLGLSICHGIITDHGGRIHVESEFGRGATFIINLPLETQTEQHEVEEPDPIQVRSVIPLKILIVEDDPLVNRFLTNVLTKDRNKVDAITNGNEAIQKVINGNYDVILMDVKLPGMSGIDIYEYLLDNASPAASKVIFVTGDIMNEETMIYIKSGEIPYVTKPIESELLFKNIIDVINQ